MFFLQKYFRFFEKSSQLQWTLPIPASTLKATFDYHINAKGFDIKKAYNQVKLFHDMASSAAHAEGIVSLDYRLRGRLNGNMQPVYPSLKGGDILSVKKVKLNGFKLFEAVGSKTDHKRCRQRRCIQSKY
jgi:AsmA protein